MINLQTNTYKTLIFLSAITCIFFSCLKTFSQEIKNNGIITETVSPLISPLQSDNDNFSYLNNDQDINSFLEKRGLFSLEKTCIEYVCLISFLLFSL